MASNFFQPKVDAPASPNLQAGQANPLRGSPVDQLWIDKIDPSISEHVADVLPSWIDKNAAVPRSEDYGCGDGSDDIVLLKSALQRSLGDINPSPITSSDFKTNGKERPATSQARPESKPPIALTYQENIDDLVLRLSNEFTPLNDASWDTLIYIGPPAKSPEQSQKEYDHVKKHFEKPHRLCSSRIKGLGSSKFDKLLKPNCSIRAEKRLKKLGVLKDLNLDGCDTVQYHIDLRPPNEDEEAVILLTDLTCTQGILTWHLARPKYHLIRTCVLGTDEFDTVSNPYYVLSKPNLKSSLHSKMMSDEGSHIDIEDEVGHKQDNEEGLAKKDKEKMISKPSEPQPPGIIAPEYLPIRHHSAVERLMQAICGNDPKLDSAPKLWTFFAVARYYDCAQNPSVNRWISEWLYGNSNVNFIQNNPEVVYRIGMGTESLEMVQDAFSILVGERALQIVNSEETACRVEPSASLHSRQFELLDDDERNRIDHAASSLVRRMRTLFESVVFDMDWIVHCDEYARLDKIIPRTPQEYRQLTICKGMIRDYVRGHVLSILCQDIRYPFSDHDQNAKETAAFRRGSEVSLVNVYNSLGAETRKFTRTFWMAVQRNRLQEERHNISTDTIHEHSVNNSSNLFLQRLICRFATDPHRGIKIIHSDDLRKEISRINDTVFEHEMVDAKVVAREFPAMTEPRASTSIPEPFSIPAFEAVHTKKSSVNETGGEEPANQSPKRRTNAPETSPSWEKRRKTIEVRDLSLRMSPSGRDEDGVDKIASGVTGRHVEENQTPELFSRMHKSSLEQFDNDSEPLSFDEKVELQHYGISPRSSVVRFDDVSNAGSQSHLLPDHAAQEDPRQSHSGVPISSPVFRRILPASNNPTALHQNPILSKVKDFMNSHWLPLQSGENSFEKLKNSSMAASMRRADPDVGMPDYSLPTRESFSAAKVIDPNVPQGGGSIGGKAFGRLQTKSHPPRQVSVSRSTQGIAVKQQFSNGYISVDTLLAECSRALTKKCEEIVYPPHLFHGSTRVPIDLVDSLVCLEDDEWKYLPLWAGGCDDGTGGVFDEVDVPNLEAGGFRGGKRGIGSVRAYRGDGDGDSSVSGTETDTSFDDIASDAISTVGKASKVATDGTQTVKSLSDTESEADFMNQDEIYEQIQALKMEEARYGKKKAGEVGGDVEEDDEGDSSTVVGAASDIQGDMFHDIDDDNDNNDIGDEDEDEDEDMEIIDKYDL